MVPVIVGPVDEDGVASADPSDDGDAFAPVVGL